jgi:hypothetical protein
MVNKPANAENLQDSSDPATVLVLGGDSIVGQALELLLGSPDFGVRFLAEPSLEEPGLLDNVGLLLISPGVRAEFREALLDLVACMPPAQRIPILALITGKDLGSPDETGYSSLSWPCKPEDIVRRIRDLLTGPAVREA